MQPERRVAKDGSWEEWVVKGSRKTKLHREDGPARTRYKDGKIVEEQWWVKGGVSSHRHREDGPALVKYEDGKVVHEEWWVNGKELLKENFKSLELVKKLKAYRLFNPIEIARLKKNAA